MCSLIRANHFSDRPRTSASKIKSQAHTVVLTLRAATDDAVGRAAQTPLFSHFSRHAQAFPATQTVDALVVDLHAFTTERRPDTAITESRLAANDLVHAPHQFHFVDAMLRFVALRRTRLLNHPTLRGTEALPKTAGGLATTCRAHQFPDATSLSMALSNDKSATRFLSREFSSSSSLSRLASDAFMPPYWFRRR